MGLSYRRRVKLGRNSWMNLSKSGPSFSTRIGRMTVNSRGRTNVRIAKGVSYRSGCVVLVVVPVAALLAAAWLTLRPA